MTIFPLTKEHNDLYCHCLEDWSPDMQDSGVHKEQWVQNMQDKGLRVKLASDGNNNIGGMIQYVPVEHSFVQGKNLYFINCIWVHGHNKGRGNFQKKGMGTALLKKAEEDAKELGAAGMAAWGIILPFFMRASWFKKHGYKTVDKTGMQRLLWKPFTQNAEPPQFIQMRKQPVKIPGQVTVTGFVNGWCPVQNINYERAKKACEEIDKAVFVGINTFNRETMLEWGISDALYIDDKCISSGPPLTFKQIQKKILKKAARLK